MIIAVTRCHCVCNSLNLSCGCYCGGSFCFNLDGPIATGGDDVGACIYPRMIGLNSDGLKKSSVMFFLPCLLLSYYWSMRICFATGEKQPIANPTVKLLFLHSGCCFEVVGTALTVKADGDDSGEYERLDGGATHALRQAKSSEIPHLWPVHVEMAMGSVTLYKCPAHNTLLALDSGADYSTSLVGGPWFQDQLAEGSM